MTLLFDTVLLILNVAACGLMLRFGGWPERLGVALVAIYFALEILLGGMMFGNWRIGASIANLVLFVGLWTMSERWGRWWLVVAGGLQLVIVLTHVLPFTNPVHLINTGVILRKLGWAAISAVLFVAAWEAWADKRFRLERGATRNETPAGPDERLATPPARS